MVRKHNIIIPALVAGILAGCSGGSTTQGASGTAPVLAATTGSATSYTSAKWGGGGYVTGIIYHPTSYNVMYARTDVGGAYRWEGNGAWTPITDGIGFNGGESMYHGIESLAVVPSNDQLVYLVAGLTTLDGNGHRQNGRLYASSNRGATWTHYDLPFPVGGNEDARAIGERLQVDPNNPSTMFYASRTAGLWKSTNAGQTWTQTGLSSTVLTDAQIQALHNVRGVEQVIFDGSTIYTAIAPDYKQAAGLTSILYKSTNGGTSWTPVTVPSNVSGYHVPHVARSGDGYIYIAFTQGSGQGAGGPGVLYKFGGSGHGESWNQLASSNYGYGGVSVFGTGSTTRVVLAITGVWNTTDPVIQLSDSAGAPGTWREIAAGMTHWGTGTAGGWVDDVKIDPTNKDHVLHVHGGGIWETWGASQSAPAWDVPLNNFEELTTSALITPPAGASYKYAASFGDAGSWLQTDLAAHPTKGPNTDWGNGYSTDVLWSDPNYIVGSASNSSTSTAYGFWSGDGGNTWSNFATLPNGAATNLHSQGNIVTTARNNIVWAVPNSVPSYTTNNGASWTSTNLPSLPAVGWDRGYRLVVDRKNPNKVYAYDSAGVPWNNTTGKVYVSTDGGHNYTLSQGSVSANLAPNAYWTTSMVVNPNVEGDLWLADGEALYHSTDSGATWTKLSGFASVAANGSTAKLMGASMIALGKAQTGSTYSAAIYVVGTRSGVWGIYHSDDGGATWARFNDDTHQFGGVDAMAADWNTYGRIYFAGAGRGVIYTN